MDRGRGRTGAALWSMIVVAALAGCGTKYVSTKEPDAQLISGHPPEEVRAAILRALGSMEGQGQTEGEAEGAVLARLGKGDRFARVSIEYDPTHYRIRYLDSSEFKTKPGANGDVLVERRYTSLERRLRGAIDTELSRPAREAATAEKNRRDYELLMQQSRAAQAQAEAQAASTPAAPAPAPAPAAAAPSPGAIAATLAGAAAANVSAPNVQLGGSIQSFKCCINGALYKCPGREAFNQCVKSGPSRCSSAGRC